MCRGDSVSRPPCSTIQVAGDLNSHEKLVYALCKMSNPSFSFNSRRSIRLQGYDYRQAGVYFVTLCTYLNTTQLGRINDGEMLHSKLGKVVDEEWQHMAKVRRNVQLDLHVVTPNHLHGVIILEEIQDGVSSRCVPTQERKDSRTLQAGSLGAIIGQFKVAVTRRARSSQFYSDQRIWQRNYHEHIVRNEESLNDIRRYIIENPARWGEDSLYVE